MSGPDAPVDAPIAVPPAGLRPVRPAGLVLSGLASAMGPRSELLIPGPARTSVAGHVRVLGVTQDSREARAGDLYAALPGAKTHGARFCAQAVKQGAVAILTDGAGRAQALATGLPVLVVPDPRLVLGPAAAAVYGFPSADLLLLGVTGTNGKTTTSYLMEAGLRASGVRTGLVGTIETRVGDTVVPSVRTTPEAPDLQALFAVMRERGVNAAAMEVSSHALALHRVDGTRFDVVAFSNLSHDHLDFHPTLEHYFQAKARLFTPGFAPLGVVNVDDDHGSRLARQASIPMLTVSARGRPDADWRAEQIQHFPGAAFVAVGPDVRAEVATVLPGDFNVANALLAFATLVAAGVEPEAAARGLGELPGVPGRMERVQAGQPFDALVDYAHTPDALATVLRAARPAEGGRLIVVLGCGGDRDASKRPLMGDAAARLADVAVLTSDNPRSEDPAVILRALESGARAVAAPIRAHLVVEPDRASAIRLAVADARPGDVVLVAGKGHEQGQEVAGVVHPFDDRVVLRAALDARGDGGSR